MLGRKPYWLAKKLRILKHILQGFFNSRDGLLRIFTEKNIWEKSLKKAIPKKIPKKFRKIKIFMPNRYRRAEML
jgi:hypothetical protein